MELITQVCDIVKQASELMKHRPSSDEVTEKSGKSDFVTETDLAVQRFLNERLTQLLPGSTVLGEENPGWDRNAEYIWIIDPIDGTSNYIRDLGASVISVGLMHHRIMEAGVVYNPYRNEMFYGRCGKGAYLNGSRIHVSDRDFSHSHLCSALSVYAKEHAPACMNIISEVYQLSDDFRRYGAAAMELSQLAAGRVELYFEMRIAPWDAAAASLLIEEAGGYWECLYDEGLQTEKLFPFIAANTKENFDRLRSIVTKHIPVIPYDGTINKA